MLPWNYGFQLERRTHHLSRRVLLRAGGRGGHVDRGGPPFAAGCWRNIARKRSRWHADFHDLPARDRVCRHVLTGEFQAAMSAMRSIAGCAETHAKLIGRHPLPPRRGPRGRSLRHGFSAGSLLPSRPHLGASGDGWHGTGWAGRAGRAATRLAGRLDLPQPGTYIEANGTAFRARKRDADVRVLAPMDGEVVETGGADRGWYLKLKPAAAGEQAFRHLLRGAEIRPWIMREMERLQLALAAEGAPPL